MTAAAVLAAALAAAAVAQPSAQGQSAQGQAVGLPGFMPQKAHCPQGFEAFATPNSLQSYRCVPKGAGAAAAAAPGTRYAVAGLSFAPPQGFRVQDDWKDDVPTLYLELEGAGTGKPTSITITRVTPGRAGGESLDAAIKRDEEWQGARETKALRVSGAKARATEVPGSARSVYLPAGRQSYYSFVYSAADEHYAGHMGDFERLLKSVRLGDAP